MHDIEIVAVWFSLIIAGMILTMLMPRIFSGSRSRGVDHYEPERALAHQSLHEQACSMVPIAEEA